MSKIDWKKPLRTVDWAVAMLVTGRQPEVYTFKSGSQRVVWVDDRVYPVDEQGICAADVEYPGYRVCKVGDPVVENVPEPKRDHLHLYPHGGKWYINACGKKQLETHEFWEEIGEGGVIVKVPV